MENPSRKPIDRTSPPARNVGERPKGAKRFSLRKPAVRLSLYAVVLLLILGSCVERIERFFIYQPAREIFLTPGDRGVPFEDVRFQASDGVKLHGWFVPARAGGTAAGRTPTLTWVHGNGGNLSHRVDNIALLHQKVTANVFIFDYRGYGRSEGTPSEEGTYRDAEGAVRYLLSRKDVDRDRLVHFGRSLGASVALEETLRRPPAGLILESPFTSVGAMAKKLYVVPIGRYMKTKYDNLSKIKKIRLPLLVLHGDRDGIVPFSMGKTLFEAANGPKAFYVIQGAGHNDTYAAGGEAYFQRLDAFIRKLFTADGSAGG